MSVGQDQKRKRGRPAGSLVPLRSDPDRLAIVFMYAMSTYHALHTAMTILDGNGTLQHNDTIARQAWLWCELRDLSRTQGKNLEITELTVTNEDGSPSTEAFPYLLFDRREQKSVRTKNIRIKGEFKKPDPEIKRLSEKYTRVLERHDDRCFIQEYSEPLAVIIGASFLSVPSGHALDAQRMVQECQNHLQSGGFSLEEVKVLFDRIRLQRNRALEALPKPPSK